MQVTEPHNAAQPLEQVISSVRAAAEDWHLVQRAAGAVKRLRDWYDLLAEEVEGK